MWHNKFEQFQYVRVVNKIILFKIEVSLFTFVLLLSFSIHSYAVESNVIPALSMEETKSLEPALAKQLGLRENSNRYELTRARQVYDQGETVLARRILTPLGISGDPDAQYLLGVLCGQDESTGTAQQNKTEAFIWFHAAAVQGHSDAQHNLALAYARGEGVEVNLLKAIQWWERAARNGNTDSQYNLGIMYALGTRGVKQNFQRARAWWFQAARHGDAAAQYNLGALYASKETPFYNSCLAMQWLNESAQNGFARAQAAIKSLEGNGKSDKACPKY